MNADHVANCEQLRTQFEGREAIYVEKGILRVRVRHIRPRVARRSISAQVEEIPTPGLGLGTFPAWDENARALLRWKIGAGDLTTVSDESWNMGYGGWSLYFAPAVIRGVVGLVSGFPRDLDAFVGYGQVLRFLVEQKPYEPHRHVFFGG